MPILSFDFTGWCRSNIETVFDTKTLKDVDVSEMPANELVEKLNSGDYTLYFADVYADAARCDNTIDNFNADD